MSSGIHLAMVRAAQSRLTRIHRQWETRVNTIWQFGSYVTRRALLAGRTTNYLNNMHDP
jgi:hypothetical protein